MDGGLYPLAGLGGYPGYPFPPLHHLVHYRSQQGGDILAVNCKPRSTPQGVKGVSEGCMTEVASLSVHLWGGEASLVAC